MVSMQSVASIVLKIVKLILNLIILILYRTGYSGQFLGVGGTWNLNEEKSPDVEIVASGIFVGYFIYTAVQLLTFCFGYSEHKRELSDTIMNFVGTFMWLAVGGTGLHYWNGYMSEHHAMAVTSEREVGLALGSLCVLSGACYLLDTVLAFVHFSKNL